MIRRAFLKRMALAAAACAFIDVPWPKREPEWEPIPGPVIVTPKAPGDVEMAQQFQDYLNFFVKHWRDETLSARFRTYQHPDKMRFWVERTDRGPIRL